MSLGDLHAEVESYRAEAGQIAEEFTTIHAQVSADPGLTPAGKRERLEPLHQQVSEQMSTLHAREKAAVKARKEKLERDVFGLTPSASNNPAQLVSYRDAQSRARELEDSDDAADLYESAKRSGDDILAAAVLEKALIRGWSSIRNDHLERHPSTRDALDDLTALAKYADNPMSNVVHYVAPTLSLPHSAGFPTIGGQTASNPAHRAPNLGDVMAQRLGL